MVIYQPLAEGIDPQPVVNHPVQKNDGIAIRFLPWPHVPCPQDRPIGSREFYVAKLNGFLRCVCSRIALLICVYRRARGVQNVPAQASAPE